MVQVRYVLFGALQVLNGSVNTLPDRLIVDMVICCMYVVYHWKQRQCSDLGGRYVHQNNKVKKSTAKQYQEIRSFRMSRYTNASVQLIIIRIALIVREFGGKELCHNCKYNLRLYFAYRLKSISKVHDRGACDSSS